MFTAPKPASKLESYYLLHAVLAEFEAQLNDFTSAAEHLRKAIRLTKIKAEQAMLANRLKDCEQRSTSTLGA
jgi:predicted RNA polymerase sigma factor